MRNEAKDEMLFEAKVYNFTYLMFRVAWVGKNDFIDTGIPNRQLYFRNFRIGKLFDDAVAGRKVIAHRIGELSRNRIIADNHNAVNANIVARYEKLLQFAHEIAPKRYEKNRHKPSADDEKPRIEKLLPQED